MAPTSIGGHSQSREQSNLSVLASLAHQSSSSHHHNSNNNHSLQHLSYGTPPPHPNEQNRGTLMHSSLTDKAIPIAQAIAAVGGNYLNHSPPPYANGNSNQNQANGEHQSSGGNSSSNGGNNYNNSSPPPPIRYPYQTGRQQQVRTQLRQSDPPSSPRPGSKIPLSIRVNMNLFAFHTPFEYLSHSSSVINTYVYLLCIMGLHVKIIFFINFILQRFLYLSTFTTNANVCLCWPAIA